MFNLTNKKYYFFGVSLLILIPGIISLLLFGLNLGIDFTGGTTVDLQFQNALPNSSSANITNTFVTLANAKDTKVYFATLSNPTNSQNFWVRVDRPVDTKFQNAITARFTDSSQKYNLGTAKALPPLIVGPSTGSDGYSLLPYQFTPIPSTTGGPSHIVTVADVNAALAAAPLPTTGPVVTTTSSTSSSIIPTVTAVATTTATAGAATGTSAPATATSVNLIGVIAGTTNQVITIQTQTQIKPDVLLKIETTLFNRYGAVYQSQVQSVGPSIAGSTTVKAILAVIAASVAILIYIGISFFERGDTWRSFRYGACALVALLHDAFVVLGIWSILGHIFPSDFKVDTLFVTAVLTVIGFSVHDTIVVFDRIRENSRRRTVETFNEIVNASLLQTMARSINTSLTVLITLSALTIFGGPSIRTFTLALLIGIFSGTYSSIFNASMLLSVWETEEWRTWFGRKSTTSVTPSLNGQRVARVTTR